MSNAVQGRRPSLQTMAAARASGSTVLAALLDDELAFDATTGTRLSNHLPMALVALDRLGASDDRLTEFARQYRGRLVPLPGGETITTFDEWRAARGRRDAYGPARTYLAAQVAELGADAAVRRHVDHLVDGLSGAAFHGIIRLAYALESRSDARVAAGLAYLTQVHQRLGERGLDVARTDDPATALDLVAGTVGLGDAPLEGNIGQRMWAVAAHDAFRGVVDWLEVSASTPARLIDAAAHLYAQSDDFTALHGLTGSHAISVVAPYVEDPAALSAWWFQALAAAYVTIGAPPLVDPDVAVAPWLAAPASWDDVARLATTSDDEHVVKLVYTARELDGDLANPLLRAVAQRQAGMAPGTAPSS
jgi:Questin oxidase-like